MLLEIIEIRLSTQSW